ncbi:MAG TPA: TonB-dependent receptor [Woeseiaceae bacterium]|nr:TonB-dependent receptor [Woeseiaceae bacterium]
MSRKRISRAAGARRTGLSNDERHLDRKPQRNLLAAAVASCLVMGAPSLEAQSAGANLRGQVRAVDGPVANTEVIATNVATGVTRRTRTTADGRYVLIGLDPGTYTVRAGDAVEVVTLAVASNSTLNLEAGDGEAPDLDTITVVGTAAQLDVLTSEVGAVVSPRLIEQLPQATRNFLEFADTVPGMAFTMDAQGFTTLRGGALSKNAGNLYIDGVGQKSYVAAGGIAGQHQSRGNPFPQLAIDQYKVITSNYKAEYGQVAGAALTAVTRSGTNDFEAELYYRFTNESLRERRPDEKLPDADKVDSQTEEWGLALGGPIIRDRLHYFLAYEYKDLVTPRSVTPDPNASGFVQFLPADIQSQFGATDQPFEEDLLFGKLSWQATDRDLLELSFQYRDEVQVDSIGGRRAAEHGRDVINKDERATLRWERSADTWFNELLFSLEDGESNPFPTGIGNGVIYAVLNRNPDNSVANEWHLIETGPSSGFDAKAQKQDGWMIANNFTFTGLNWHGEHTIKVGVSYKDIDLVFQDAGAINPQFKFEVDANGVASQPYRVDFLAPFNIPGQRATVVADARQYGFYIQDDWAVNEHLVLNFGIRWDYEKNPAYTDFVTSQDFVDTLFGDDPANPGRPWADRLLPSGINAADYVSTGNNRSDYDDAWAPRLGFSYDIFGDERHVIHGGAGRSYDRNLFSVLSLEVSKAALSPVAIYFQDPDTGECYRDDGRPCVAWDPEYFTGGIPALSAIPVTTGSAELFMLNNNLKTPYADQYSLGISNEIGEWRTDVTVQRILAYDGFIFTLINRYPDGSFFQNGSQPWGEPVPGYANTILGSNGIKSRNTQLLLSADKPYDRESGWGLSLAYTYTDAKHNRKIDDNFAFDKPTIDQYPFIKVNDVPEHRFVAAGSIDGPWGMTFGAKIVLETPRPLNEVRDYGNRPADGSFSQPIAIDPPGTGSFLIGGDIWGYRTVDFQATKVFNIGDHELSARVNLLNAFDYENYSSFNILGVGSGGVLDPQVEVNEFGDILYVPRTLSFEVGFRF